MSMTPTSIPLHTSGQLAVAKAGAARAASAALAARPGVTLASAARNQGPAPAAIPPGGAGKVSLPRGSIVNLLV
ncbi:MAG TPA: hypothetical protein VEJ16_16900 [Alphaproteobacteria bacterium]|nr:hypothetical protein [Alphaproteobacteria bacterium]